MEVSFDLFARMSVISGLESLRAYIKSFPEVDPLEAIEALKASYLTSNYDYESALIIDSLIPKDVDPGLSFYQSYLAALIHRTRPLWLPKVVMGREIIRYDLGQDQRQCFDVAGLFDPDPSDEVIQWWDRLSALSRSEQDQDLTNIGREGERLSYEYEKKRLQELGIEAEVKWVALDDQTVGYDISSYTETKQARLIEVKACQSNSLRIFLTRKEWDTAEACMSEYVFHIWHLPSEKLKELSVESIKKHIPIDQGGGRWDKVQITLT